MRLTIQYNKDSQKPSTIMTHKEDLYDSEKLTTKIFFLKNKTHKIIHEYENLKKTQK